MKWITYVVHQSRHARRWFVFGAAFVVVLAGVFVFKEHIRMPWVAGNQIIATVNGERVETGEFMLLIGRSRSKAYQHFKEKYNAAPSQQFWSTRFGDEVPSAYVKSLAMQEAVRVKVQQAWAKQNGLIEDTSYSAFMKKLRLENERREKETAAGRPIFGPKQYDADGYYDYLFSNLVLRLKEKLETGESASSVQLEEDYQNKLDELVKTAKIIVQQEAYDRIVVK